MHHGEQQRCDPEHMVVGEQGEQAQDGNQLHLHMMAAVRYPLRQGMQLEIEIADHQHYSDQKNNHAHH
jgi:hypothetical protein